MLIYQSLAIFYLWAPGLSLAFLHYKQGFNEHLNMCPLVWTYLFVYFEASNNSLPKILQVQTDYSPVISVGLILDSYPNQCLVILD